MFENILEKLLRLIFLIIILLSAYGFGGIFFKIFRLTRRSKLKDVYQLTKLSIGLGLLAYLTLFIGLLGKLSFLPIITMSMAFYVAAIMFLRSNMEYIRSKISSYVNFFKSLCWQNKYYLSVILIFCFFNLIGSFAPPLGVDDIKYNFAIPKRFIAEGSVSFVPDYARANLPFLVQMLWTLALSFDTAELAQLLNFSISILLIFWIIKLCNLLKYEVRNILLAIIFFLSITTVSSLAQTGAIENGGSLFFIGGVYFLINNSKKMYDYQSLLIAGVLFGFFTSSKIIFIAMSGIITIYYGLSTSVYHKSLKSGLMNSLIFGAIIILVSGIWYIKSYLITGNPFYPLLNNVFDGFPKENLTHIGVKNIENAWNQLGRFPGSFLTFFSDLIINPKNVRGHISPFFLGLAPLILFRYNSFAYKKKILLGIALVYIFIWILLYSFIRIGIPALLLVSIILANIFTDRIFEGKFIRVFNKVMLSTWIVISLFSNFRLIADKIPVVLNIEDEKSFIERVGKNNRYKFFNFPAITFMNKNLSDDSVVLLWSNDGYYLNKKYYYALEFITRMSDSEKLFKAETTINELKKFGITHVAMTDNYLRNSLRKLLENSSYINEIYKDKYMTVCSIL